MQQMREAFPWNQAPRYVLRDRDAIYGQDFAGMMKGMGMEEVMSAPRSPWQNPYVERIVGSIRRECLDHVIVWNERSLRRSLRNYFAYYHRSRTHLSLGEDSPEPRPIQPLEMGPVVVLPQVVGCTTATNDGRREQSWHPLHIDSTGLVILCSRSETSMRHFPHNSRQCGKCFRETEEFLSYRVLVALLQCDRIFGSDSCFRK